MNYDYDDWLSDELKKGPPWGSFFIVFLLLCIIVLIHLTF